MGEEGWRQLYLPLRTTEYNFGFRAMNSLIGFPPVSSLNFSTTSVNVISFYGVNKTIRVGVK